MSATSYIDKHRDQNGNVPVLLNCGTKTGNRIMQLRISAELAKALYLSGTAVYYTNAIRYQLNGKTIPVDYYQRLSERGKRLFGVIEIYADDYPNLRVIN